MEIHKVKRTKKEIQVEWTEESGTFQASERENPLPAFPAAMEALIPVALAIGHLPGEYASGLRVVGFTMSEQSGSPAVSLICKKDLDDAAKTFDFRLPARALQEPSSPGTYTPALSKEHAAIVTEAIEQAKAYVRGERAQGMIAFDVETASEDGSGVIEPDDLNEPMDLK